MITKDIMITVNPGEDYCFEVTVSAEELNIVVREENEVARKLTQQVNFGSVEEMRAVARAMLQACTIHDGQP